MNCLEQFPLSTDNQSVLRPSLGLIIIGFLIAGVLYCILSVSLAQLFFPKQVNGSLIQVNGEVIGSSLVGQNFVSELYFHGRPSATQYNVDAMAGSNLAISNPELQKQIHIRTVQFIEQNQTGEQQIPSDIVTASASGIDPNISPNAALLQVKRIAQQRHLSEFKVRSLVQRHIESEQFNIYGQARVNVLNLNLALDELSSTSRD